MCIKLNNYIELARNESLKSPLHHKHGAVLFKGGKVFATGHNDYQYFNLLWFIEVLNTR